MTQQKTTIQSQNAPIAAYDNDGVVTPASGLEELFLINLETFPADQETFEYFLANEVSFQVLETEIKTSGGDANSSLTLYVFKEFQTIEIPIKEGNQSYSENQSPIIASPRSTFFLYNVGLTVESVRFICKRIATLETLRVSGSLSS